VQKISIYLSNKIYGNDFSDRTRKLLWPEISKMLIAVSKNKFIVLLIKIFGAVSLPIVARTRLQTFQTHSSWQTADCCGCDFAGK